MGQDPCRVWPSIDVLERSNAISVKLRQEDMYRSVRRKVGVGSLKSPASGQHGGLLPAPLDGECLSRRGEIPPLGVVGSIVVTDADPN
jgi:hypothetical protein